MKLDGLLKLEEKSTLNCLAESAGSRETPRSSEDEHFLPEIAGQNRPNW